MRRTIFIPVLLGFCIFAFVAPASRQEKESKTKEVLRITGKISAAVVKTTAKVSWELTKLTGKHVVAPTAKHVVVPMAKATPPVAKATAKLAGKGIKNGVKGIAKLIRREKNEDDPDSTGAGH